MSTPSTPSVIVLHVTYLENDTIRITATIKDFNQTTLIDPDTHLIQIFDANLALMQTFTAPFRESLGIFHVDYTIGAGAVGTWRCDWQITAATLPSKIRVTFPVIL